MKHIDELQVPRFVRFNPEIRLASYSNLLIFMVFIVDYYYFDSYNGMLLFPNQILKYVNLLFLFLVTFALICETFHVIFLYTQCRL
jgi:hypothetical protein